MAYLVYLYERMPFLSRIGDLGLQCPTIPISICVTPNGNLPGSIIRAFFWSRFNQKKM
ncbi:MAG: hypothetical protein ACI9CE_003343 [Flavobacterium sp.]|jgi:hypothetical protein